MKRKNVIISALVLAIALTGCSGKKVDYNMETENINTKAGSDISAFDDSTKWTVRNGMTAFLLRYRIKVWMWIFQQTLPCRTAKACRLLR